MQQDMVNDTTSDESAETILQMTNSAARAFETQQQLQTKLQQMQQAAMASFKLKYPTKITTTAMHTISTHEVVRTLAATQAIVVKTLTATKIITTTRVITHSTPEVDKILVARKGGAEAEDEDEMAKATLFANATPLYIVGLMVDVVIPALLAMLNYLDIRTRQHFKTR
jgi:cell fate (sporulation/competence/biofilm development) regulator YlbF (YheA/YmcA/DUF963 family)